MITEFLQKIHSARFGLSILLWCFIAITSMAQESSTTLSGNVKDANGDGIPGVNITIKGTSVGTVTDINGSYKLNDVAGNATLIFSYIGYETVEVNVGGKSVLDVTMNEDIEKLQEVVVIGYGQTQSKQTVTTSIVSIDSKDIEALSTGRPNSEQMLQGTSPGVTITQNSGSPGAPMTVRLRGVSTAGSAQPLYLVDGLQVPNINYLNPSDIETMTVLKDAAASSIYGARGGNGVILVKTKRGAGNNGKPTFTFGGYSGVQNLANTPDLMNKDEYIEYYNAYQSTQDVPRLISEDDAALLADTDWYDEVFEDNAPMHSYNAALSGAGEKYGYYISGSIFDQQGMVGGEAGKSQYTRNNIKANVDFDILDNLSIKFGGDLVNIERDYLFENQAGTGTAIMNYVNSIPAIYPTFDADGIPVNLGNQTGVDVNGVSLPAVGAVTNPFIALINTNNRTNTDIKSFNISASWAPVENLEFTTSYATFEDISLDRNFTPAYDYPSQGLNNPFGTLIETVYESSYSQVESTVKYNFTNLTDQNLEILGGFSVVESDGYTEARTGEDFLVNDFESVNFGLIRDNTTITLGQPYSYETGLLSFFGRVSYDYQEKYLLMATVRRDGSSKFGSDNRAGIFPSFSAGWVASEENFMNGISWIDLLKVRASWGINGIDNISNYQYSSVIGTNSGPSFNDDNTPGISIDVLPNPDVKWEEVSQTSIGIDLTTFNEKLGITLDYYDKRTSDMLLPVGTPLYTGYDAAAANSADIKNNGVELMISYNEKYNNGFSWRADVNFATNNNEVISTGDNGEPLTGGNLGYIYDGPITRTDAGFPIASFYGYQVDAINSEGVIIFKDLDNSGVIDDGDVGVIGDPFPDFTYGVNLSAQYKGFDFLAFLYGSQGNDIFDATVRLDAPYTNRPVSYGEAGAPANTLGEGPSSDQTAISDFYIKDGSFAKLKNITLGYSLPKSIIEGAKLSSVRFYVTAQNLFTLTGYDGADPEIGQASTDPNAILDLGIDRGFYPQPRTFMVGFQARF